MARILISGLINIETTLKVDAFPIDYSPARYPFFGIDSSVSGVGYNVAKALRVLGDEVALLSLVGEDLAGQIVFNSLESDGIDAGFVLTQLSETPQSVILYDPAGRRQINVDLKDIQEQIYPLDLFMEQIDLCDIAALCNINFSRPFLEIARQKGKLVATDLHAIADLDNAYDHDFAICADILFMSDENLPRPAWEWARTVLDRFTAKIVVIGLGEGGALLAQRGDSDIEHIPAVSTRPVVNTIGAGDALFASFLHFYLQSREPHEALEKAVIFASYKIGEKGAATGFLDESALLNLWQSLS